VDDTLADLNGGMLSLAEDVSEGVLATSFGL